MTPTEDHLTSLDSALAAARNSWSEERKSLLDRIFALETELLLYKDHHRQAVEHRAHAERITAKLIAQFGMVAIIFDEAKELAIESKLLPTEKITAALVSMAATTADSLPKVNLPETPVVPPTKDSHS